MPRDQILRARTAARRHGAERHFDVDKQPTVLEGVTVTIYDFVMTQGARAAIIEVEKDVVQPMIEKSAEVGVRVGPRFTQTSHQGIARLESNGYIEYIPHRDDVEKFRITEPFQTIIQELTDKLERIRVTFAEYSIGQKHRYKCAFFRTKLRRNFKRNATRRELDLENRRIKFTAKEHARICPILRVRSNSVVTEATEMLDHDQTHSSRNISGPSRTTDDRDNWDSMYVDDVPRAEPVASGSRAPMPQTPIRRSHTLNNPAAYPSPESLARQNPPAPLTPERTPSLSRSISTQPGDLDLDLDLDMDDNDEEELPRAPTVLFNQNVPDPVVALNEQITGLMAQITAQDARHQERLAALQVENNERLAAQKVELDEQLAALKTDFDEQLTTKSAEKDRSWLAKVNALRWVFRIQNAVKENTNSQLRQQEALLVDRINRLEEEQQRQQHREQALRDQIAELEVKHEEERQELLDKIRELEEEMQRLQGQNQSLYDTRKKTAQLMELQMQKFQAVTDLNIQIAALHQ